MGKHAIYQIRRYIKECGDNHPKLEKFLDDNMGILWKARGSQHNHQAWEGGYLQHVADCMSLVTIVFNATDTKYWPLPFRRHSAMLVMFLHDIHKPWMLELMDADPEMQPWSCAIRETFRKGIIAKYNIALTPEEEQALLYVHGELGAYSPNERVMNELGALCHAVDTLSARLWHSRNKPVNA